MASKSPFFSIIIPTRNRSMLLRAAIQSILRQSFNDWEIIVFDNASEDNYATRSIVEQINDERIRYFRSEEWINVQDAYEEAFKMAQGQFIHAMGDDDVLISCCLERVKYLIEKYGVEVLCIANKSTYFYPDWVEEDKRNSLILGRYSYACNIFDSKVELRSIFEKGLDYVKHPIVTNSFIHKELLDYLMVQYKHILLNDHFGDISIAIFLLSFINSYLFVDEPLRIAGASGISQSAQFVKRESSNYLDILDTENQIWFSNREKINYILRDVPVKIDVYYNLNIATLLQQKRLLSLPFELNWKNYFKSIGSILCRRKERGIDDSQLIKEFFEALKKQRINVRLKALLYFYTPEILKNFARKLRQSILLNYQQVVIRGESAGFNDILGAAEYIERHFATNLVNHKLNKI